MAIRAVLFDIGGVLEIAPALRDFEVFGAWEAGLGLRAGEIGARSADIWAGGRDGRLSEEQVTRALTGRLAWSEDQVEAFMADFWDEYLGSPNEELIRYFRGLRSRCHTGIISNSFAGAREREQAAYRFGEIAEVIVYSHEAGICKPDPRIYLLACEKLRVHPEDAVFLDDQETCVSGANDVGMHALLYDGAANAMTAIEALLSAGTDPEADEPTGHP